MEEEYYSPDTDESSYLSFLFDDDSILTLQDNYPTIEYPKKRIGRYIADDVVKLMVAGKWTDGKTAEYIKKTYGNVQI